MLSIMSAIVWAFAGASPVAAAESAPAVATPGTVLPRLGTLLDAGPWFPETQRFPETQPASRPAAPDWAQDLRSLCAADRKCEEQRLQSIYGVGEYSGHLFESIRHAAAIVPRFTDLVYEPSERYMPQMGLLLVEYLELPTRAAMQEQGSTGGVTTAPTATQTASAAIVQSKASSVLGVRDFVNGRLIPGAATPEVVAQELRQHADACSSRLTSLRHVNAPDATKARLLTELLDRIELNADLGSHLSHKILAALAWERFRKGDSRQKDECLRHLRESIEDWSRVVTVANRLYPQAIPFWQSRMSSGPPWSLKPYQASYRRVLGHWREQYRVFEAEYQLITESEHLKKGSTALPLWDLIVSVPSPRLDLTFACPFSTRPDRRFTLKDGATITSNRRLTLTGKSSLLIDTRALGMGQHLVFQTEPNHATMLAYRSYQISFLYRVIDRGGQDNEPFEIGLMGPDGQPIPCEFRFWGAPESYIDTRVLRTPRLDRDDYSFYIKVHGPAAIVIDDLRVSALKDE